MSAPEEDLRRGMAILDQLRSQIESLAQQHEIVRVSLEEHLRARETLLRYKAAGKGAEILVPVGANSFVKAEVRDADKAFVGIGSDLVLHDDVDAHMGRLDARIKSIQEAANAIGQRLMELQSRADAQGSFLQGLYDRIQGEKGERT